MKFMFKAIREEDVIVPTILEAVKGGLTGYACQKNTYCGTFAGDCFENKCGTHIGTCVTNECTTHNPQAFCPEKGFVCLDKCGTLCPSNLIL